MLASSFKQSSIPCSSPSTHVLWHAGSLSYPYDVGRPDEFMHHLPTLYAAAALSGEPAEAGAGAGALQSTTSRHEAAEGVCGFACPVCATSPCSNDAGPRGPACTHVGNGLGAEHPLQRDPCPSSEALREGSNDTGVAPCAGEPGALPGAAAAASAGHAADAGRGAQQRPVYVVCRRGNDSQRAVQLLQPAGFPHAKDLRGGLQAWAEEADAAFPVY